MTKHRTIEASQKAVGKLYGETKIKINLKKITNEKKPKKTTNQRKKKNKKKTPLLYCYILLTLYRDMNMSNIT